MTNPAGESTHDNPDAPAQADKPAWQKVRDLKTPWWVDGLILVAIAALTWDVSAAVGEVQYTLWS